MNYLTVREAATKLKCSDSMIREMFRSGRLKGRRLGKKLIRIEETSLGVDVVKPLRHRKPLIDHIGDCYSPKPKREPKAVKKEIDLK